MAGLGVVRAGIPLLIAAGLAVLSTVVVAVVSASLFASDGSAAGPTSADIAIVAVDADPTGNSPRSVGSIEDSLFVAGCEPVEIDIVIANPGIPADRGIGIAAYQFRLFYDPAIVWVSADDSNQLLAQATGSRVISFSEVAISGTPNKSGDYLSLAADFGPKGIEPAGASETGPGVIARITLLPQGSGSTALLLADVTLVTLVTLVDDDSQFISVGSVQSATIHVGEPCDEDAGGSDEDKQEEEQRPEQGQQTTPSPDSGDSGDSEIAAATSAPAPDQDTDSDGLSDAQEQQLGTNPNKLDTDGDGYSDSDEIAQGSDPLDASSTPEASPPAAVPNGGGPPPRVGGTSALFVVSGLIATFGGAGLLIGTLAFKGRARAALPSRED